ncbi:MAG: HEAT repeat domain-containing protein [Kofleriaceae bacterium]
MSRPDDVARRKFLGTLVDALGSRWVVGYSEAKTFGVIAATLRCEGVEGFVQVVPSVVENNVITWNPFPGTGRAHFDIKVDGVGHQRTCILADAVGILERWAKAKQPVVRSAASSILPVVRPALEAIAKAPLATLVDEVDAGAWSVTNAGKKQLRDARDKLDAARIARAFPRDDQGRLVATRVLLAPVASTKKLAAGRQVFLAVRGPTAKRDGERLVLELVDANDLNETHRWMDARWSWRSDSERPADDQQALECAALLDAGDFDKALAMYGIALSKSAVKVLEGVPRGSHSSHEAEHREALRRVLWSTAVWRLKEVRWGSMALLPHQRHQVKAWISWQPPGEITISSTGSNTRLARCRWARDIDWDLARLGVTRSTEITAKPATAKQTKTKTEKTEKKEKKEKNEKEKNEKEKKPQKSLVEMLVGKALWKVDTALKHARQRPRREPLAELFAYANGRGDGIERANALWVAIGIADTIDGASFVRYLDDKNVYVRRMGIEGVKRLGYVDAVPDLAGLACESFSTRRVDCYHAITAMKSLSGKQGPSGILPYFASEHPRVREAACRAFEIYDQGRAMARPYLEKALLDDNAAVVAAAKSALRVIAKRSGE